MTNILHDDHYRSVKSVTKKKNSHYKVLHVLQWLAMVSLAILYNVVFVIGRAVFWELDNLTFVWFILDYLCDAIYVFDTIIHMHEGELPT